MLAHVRERIGMPYEPKEISRLQAHKMALSNLGVQGYIRRIIAKKTGRGRLISKHLASPVAFRPQTSDMDVFSQIFVEREYQAIDSVKSAELILDCGANVGYSSAYFLSRFPQAMVIAVEPEIGNFRQLRINTKNYGTRIRSINAGIWSKEARLSILPTKIGDEWGFQVREDPEGAIPAIDIQTLLNSSGHPRISILKVDVEGSEIEIFSNNYAWIDVTDVIVIELHGHECETTFFKAIEGKGFDIARWGELTIAVRKLQLEDATEAI
ncbi:FkbM family methyltransferase [Methylobacterium sp. DM1]|nr:FkbM family methyltransferase [Methylobacterium sp. DM1]